MLQTKGAATGNPTNSYLVAFSLNKQIKLIMRWMKWFGIAAVILLIISCFSTWVVIESKNIVVTGVDATGTSFGKPGYFHLFFSFFFILFTFIPRIWAKRTNLLVTALNMAWAIRNYFIVTACQGGDCPDKHTSIFILLLASLIMLISALFPDIQLPEHKGRKQ